MTTKNRLANLPWFRCSFEDWESEEVRSLDLATVGFLHLLRMKIIERGEPFPRAFADRLGREHGVARKTIDKLLGKLAEHGLIIMTEAGIWCEDLADEIEFREARSEKISERNRKTSQKRWEKTKQNQSKAMPDRDNKGRPTAVPLNEIDRSDLNGREPLSADAERPPATNIGADNSHGGHEDHVGPETYVEDDEIEISGQGPCHVERVASDFLITRSAVTGDYVFVSLNSDGRPNPATAHVLGDEFDEVKDRTDPDNEIAWNDDEKQEPRHGKTVGT